MTCSRLRRQKALRLRRRLAQVLPHERRACGLARLFVHEQAERADQPRDLPRETRLADARLAHEHKVDERLAHHLGRDNEGVDDVGDLLLRNSGMVSSKAISRIALPSSNRLEVLLVIEIFSSSLAVRHWRASRLSPR